MRKWIVIASVVAVLVALTVIGLVNLDSYLNRNKDWLAGQAEAALGRSLRFEEIGVSLWGGIGAQVRQLQIGDDPAYSSEAFIRADRLRIAIKVLPALFGRYEVRHFVMERPVVTVIQTKDGFNFDSIASGGGEPPEPAAEDTGAGASGDASAEMPAFLVSALKVKDAEVHFIDRTSTTPGQLVVQQVNIDATDISLSEPMGIEIAAALPGSDDQNVRFKGEIGPIGTIARLSETSINATIKVDPVDVDALRTALPTAAAQIPAGLDFSGPLRFRAQVSGSPGEVNVSELDVAMSLFGAKERNVTITGTVGPIRPELIAGDMGVDLTVELGPIVIDELKELEMMAGVVPPRLSAPEPVHLRAVVGGTLDELRTKASFDASDATLTFGSGFVKPKGVPARIEVEATRAGGAVEVTQLTARLAELNLAGRGRLVVTAPTSADMRIEIQGTPLGGWSRLLPALAPYELSGQVKGTLNAKGAFAAGGLPPINGAVDFDNVGARIKDSPQKIEGFTTTVSFTGDRAVLPPTTFSVGGSPVELEATVDHLAAPILNFKLTSNELRAASLGVAAEGTDDEVLRGLSMEGTLRMTEVTPNFRGKIRSSSGRLRNIEYQSLRADVGLRDEVVTLEPMTLQAYGGTVSATGRYDMRDPNVPRFDMQSKVDGVDLRGLAGGTFPTVTEKIEGHLDADLSLDGSGSEWAVIQRTLSGDGHAQVKDGALKGVNIAEAVLGAAAGAPGLTVLVPGRIRQQHSSLFNDHNTTFDTLGGSVRIVDGAVHTDDIKAAAKDFAITGRGKFTFESRVDFAATFHASKSMTRDIVGGAAAAKYLVGPDGTLTIPFSLTGVLPNVRAQPDLGYIAKAVSGSLIQKGIGDLLGSSRGGSGGGAAASGSSGASGGESLGGALGEALGGFLGTGKSQNKDPGKKGKKKKKKKQ